MGPPRWVRGLTGPEAGRCSGPRAGVVVIASLVVAVGLVVAAGRVAEAIVLGVVQETGAPRPHRRRRVAWCIAKWLPSMGRRAAWCGAAVVRCVGSLAGLAGAGTARTMG